MKKPRNRFKVCVEIMEVIRNQPLNFVNISIKANVNIEVLRKYLGFLEKEVGYVDSCETEKHCRHGPVKNYRLNSEGTEFIREWHIYRKKHDLDDIENNLNLR